jgi:hypothetical protein
MGTEQTSVAGSESIAQSDGQKKRTWTSHEQWPGMTLCCPQRRVPPNAPDFYKRLLATRQLCTWLCQIVTSTQDVLNHRLFPKGRFDAIRGTMVTKMVATNCCQAEGRRVSQIGHCVDLIDRTNK